MASNPSLRPNILLGVTGSVATIKLPLLSQALSEVADLRVVATASSQHFFTTDQVACGDVEVFTDESDWRDWQKVGDPVLHIELRRWADIFVIAPLSANTLAKMANGMCDNLLTCIVRAWDFKNKLLVAPAMNTMMWESPFTAKHLAELTALGATVLPPVAKKLACGDVGNGAMASVESIVDACMQAARERGFDIPSQSDVS